MPIIYTENRRLYKCDCCEKVDAWNDNWAWYGSWRQYEDFGLKGVTPVITICSADCRIKLIASGKIPHEGIDDKGDVIDQEEERR